MIIITRPAFALRCLHFRSALISTPPPPIFFTNSSFTNSMFPPGWLYMFVFSVCLSMTGIIKKQWIDLNATFTRGVSQAKDQSLKFGDNPDYIPDPGSGLGCGSHWFYQRCVSVQGTILQFRRKFAVSDWLYSLKTEILLSIQGSKICPVRKDQQSGKDEFSFNEIVALDECPCLTIIRKDKWYFWEGVVDFLASCPTGRVEI